MGIETAIIGAAVVGAAGSAMAADSAAGAASDAADTSADAAKYQADIQQQMYEQTRADQTPWRDAGSSALSALLFGTGLASSYQPAGTGGMTAEQLRAELLPQYTTAATGGWDIVNMTEPSGDGIAGMGGSVTIRNSQTGEMKVLPYKGGPEPGYWETNLFPGQGLNDVLAPYTGSSAGTVDEAALQAEISRRLAEQSAQAGQATGQFSGATGINTGDLLRSFGMSDFEADPGYQFRMDEGMKALQRSQAAKGGLISGAAMKGIEDWSQGLASQEYQNAYNRFGTNQSNQFNRLASIAGIGQTANNALASAGSGYANALTGISQTNAANQGNALLAGANARSSGYTGAANALSNAFSGGGYGGGSSGAWNIPSGFGLGNGYYAGAQGAMQGYEPFDYAGYNAMGGFYD